MSASPVSLVSAEAVSVSFGRDPVLDRVSLGISAGDRIGVVGRNGGGKSTLISVLTGRLDPQSGRVATMRGLRTDLLAQADELDADSTVRAAVLGEDADHVWAAERQAREVVEHVLAGIDLDRPIGPLSGGERRRVALAALLVRDQDLLVLDEPTNHLDIEMISWLADHLNARFAGPRGRGLVVVTHDRWFLDAICDQTWEVHDGTVSAYEGGYAAYVLARAERDRQAAASAVKRANLVRKELAWLRRGPPARTSKPKFRIDAATALIDDEPPARDSLALTRLAGSRLGKKVLDIEDVTLRLGDRVLLDNVTARFGPGERVGVLGPNGAGKTTLLRLFTGELTPDSGGLQRGSTVRIGVLGQGVGLERPAGTPLSLVEGVARVATSDGGEVGGTSLLERFGFTGDRLTTPIAQLSGGEQRRLQILRVLLAAPNVLLLDEPTNDLDIDSLTVLEDFLDTWPGTVFVVSHDRYFLERTCDTVWTLPGDGSFRLLTRGVEGYLEERRGCTGVAAARSVPDPTIGGGSSPAELRQAKKTLAKLDRQLESLTRAEQRVHDRMIEHATDGEQIIALDVELRELAAQRARVEDSWLVAAEAAGS